MDNKRVPGLDQKSCSNQLNVQCWVTPCCWHWALIRVEQKDLTKFKSFSPQHMSGHQIWSSHSYDIIQWDCWRRVIMYKQVQDWSVCQFNLSQNNQNHVLFYEYCWPSTFDHVIKLFFSALTIIGFQAQIGVLKTPQCFEWAYSEDCFIRNSKGFELHSIYIFYSFEVPSLAFHIVLAMNPIWTNRQQNKYDQNVISLSQSDNIVM